MYITNKGIVSNLVQYECNNVPQVKNKINELTKTNSVNDDWKEYCYEAKNQTGYACIDYMYFDEDGKDYDCSVNIGYDAKTRQYLIYIEVD